MCVDDYIVVPKYHCSFMPKFMLHNSISIFQQVPVYQHADFWNYCLEHWGSTYFKVIGPYGGPLISEGVLILQNYFEVIGLGGPNSSK